MGVYNSRWLAPSLCYPQMYSSYSRSTRPQTSDEDLAVDSRASTPLCRCKRKRYSIAVLS